MPKLIKNLGSWFACKFRFIRTEDVSFMIIILTRLTGANGVFAETILDIAKRKPHLIFKEPVAPYEI